MEVTKHFTATVFVVFKGKTLLHMHKKLNRWLPVGGHIDRDEIPQVAAVREAKEEAGIDVELFCPRDLKSFSDVKELIPPVHMLLEDINEYHQHIDFIFYGTSKSFEIGEGAEAADTLRWFTIEELKATQGMPADVIFLAEEAINLLG